MGESYLGDSVPVTGNIEKKGFAIASMVLGILSLLFVLFTSFLVSVFLVGDNMMWFLIEFSKIYG